MVGCAQRDSWQSRAGHGGPGAGRGKVTMIFKLGVVALAVLGLLTGILAALLVFS
jgi:hypothetical protein